MGEVLRKTGNYIDDVFETELDNNAITVLNTLGFDREEIIYIKDCPEKIPSDKSLLYQWINDMHGQEQLCIANVRIPSLGGTVITLEEETSNNVPVQTPFTYEDNVLTTPYARIAFNEDGTIGSFIDTRVGRDLRGKGLPLNTFLMAEDVPSEWDSWDIDADCQMKFMPCAKLLDRKIVADGSIQFRIRCSYRISEKSTIVQDMVFYSTTPRVDFETIIDWKDKHRFLKVGFDTSIRSNYARHEIQFGYCLKPTTRNNTYEQAMFEVVNHKYTDLSETRYGIAILNDCKYGISVEGSDIRLSLHKGGCRPDPRGDAGIHECVYSLQPHIGSFNAGNVVLPAYSLNIRPIIRPGRSDFKSFARVDCDNIIIETIKPCEENQKAFILRLYETEGTFTRTRLTLGIECKAVEMTNMLEEITSKFKNPKDLVLEFRPFEIKTIKIGY
jgi:alpha-mannosidase